MQSKYDLAYFMVYNKDLIIKEAEPKVMGWVMSYEDRNNKFKESQYVKDLGDEVALVLYDVIKKYYTAANAEELMVLFKEEEVRQIINKHYVREWLYV